MKSLVTTVTVKQKTEELAEKLFDAAFEYWDHFHCNHGSGAVVWVEDTQGRMIVLTRGEYKQQVKDAIGEMIQDDIFFDEVERE